MHTPHTGHTDGEGRWQCRCGWTSPRNLTTDGMLLARAKHEGRRDGSAPRARRKARAFAGAR